MTPLSINKNITIVNADCMEYMRTMEENSVDAIVTDPPYGIGFMNKEWDNPQKERELIEREKRRSEQRFREGKSPTTAPFSQSIRPGLPIKGAKEDKWYQEWTEKWATECLRVLKPGGHLLSFGGARTYHRLTCGIEDAGFEIRDMVEWIYGSGFPKSLNIGKAVDKMMGNKREVVGKNPNHRLKENYRGVLKDMNQHTGDGILTEGTSEFEGLGTALKPAHEPICLARKPISEPTIAQNCLKWGTGGLSIDECRIGYNGEKPSGWFNEIERKNMGFKLTPGKNNKITSMPGLGRFPANLILTCICDEVKEGKEFISGSFPEERGETAFFGLNKKHSHRVGQVKDKAIIHTNPNCPCYLLDRQSGKLNKQGLCKSDNKSGWQDSFIGGKIKSPIERELYLDTGGASRFFYQAKASRSERNAGCEEMEEKKLDEGRKEGDPGGDNPRNRGVNPQTNFHPTVKSVSLMQYLIKLVSREGQIVLDPFMGSGSTLIACENLGRKGIGIEKDKGYFEIATARLKNMPAKLF